MLSEGGVRPVLHVRKGDYVTVLGGRDKGKTGRILRVIPRKGMVVVEKIGVVKKNTRPTQKNPQGGIVDMEKPIPASRVMAVCMHCKRPTRLKRTRLASGDKVRVCRHCNEQMDKV